MKTRLLSAARQNWNSLYADPEVNRALQLKWARAVDFLGDRWPLAKNWTRADIEQERLSRNTCIKWECKLRRTA